jgi:hypothetical protein
MHCIERKTHLRNPISYIWIIFSHICSNNKGTHQIFHDFKEICRITMEFSVKVDSIKYSTVKDSIGRILPMFLVFFHLFWSNIVSDVPSFPKGVVVITESNRITPIFTERNWFDPTPWIGDNYNISSERANLNEPKIYKWLLDNTDSLIVGFWTFIGKCM